ncbi:MAG: GatB/YqeY domain-containing protein [Acidobacteriaceae bacterium]
MINAGTNAGTIAERINQDIITAMKARDAERVTTLRMVKTAIRNKEIDKREPLTDAEALQTLTTMIKQRRESIDQFNKGNRPELAAKEATEIELIEAYMPKAAGEAEIRALVQAAVGEVTASSGHRPSAREMGTVMKAVQAKIAASGVRAEGRLVSELVKAELTPTA